MISVVMAYHNRPDHLKNTLESYNHFYKDLDYELVVVEDSPPDSGKACEAVLLDNRIKFKHVMVCRNNQPYRNPGVLYNKGVELAEGEFIHLTNPENLHCGPILTHCLDHITEENYLVYACRTLRLLPVSFQHALANIDGMTNWDEAWGWYQHSVIYNRLLHFAAVISKKLYTEIGGFDPRFDNGIGFEDNDFIRRIKQLEVPVLTFDEPFAAHQSHDRGHLAGNGYSINQQLYQEIWGESTIEHWRN